jgi:hypothetical protein
MHILVKFSSSETLGKWSTGCRFDLRPRWALGFLDDRFAGGITIKTRLKHCFASRLPSADMRTDPIDATSFGCHQGAACSTAHACFPVSGMPVA